MTKAFAPEDKSLGRKRLLLAGGYTTVILILTGLLFDYYFDLNDDVLIKDILAGVQTGTPSGYSIQMLYPISVFISFFYRLARGADWFGLFLCACQYGCIFFIAQRSLMLMDAAGLRGPGAAKRQLPVSAGLLAGILLLVLQGILLYGLFLWELVYVQYTVTCGLLTAAGTFLLFTAEEDCGDPAFWQSNRISMLLLVIAFYIRTEMFLLLVPYIGAAGMVKWAGEGFLHRRRRYLAVIGIVAAGMAAGYAVHMAAYAGPEWKEFLRIFDARTQIYDYYDGAPPYEEHASFYDSAGMGREGYVLLNNYNYGIDGTIDAALMEQVEAYAGEVYEAGHDTRGRLRTAAWEYKQRLLMNKDMPYMGLVCLGYLGVLAALLYHKKAAGLWQPALLFAARSVSWLYILYGGRVVGRITKPLYFMELLLLAAMAWRALAYNREEKKAAGPGKGCVKRGGYLFFGMAAVGVLAVWGICLVPGSLSEARQEQARRAEINAPYQELAAYLKMRPERFYYLDVYSTVYFSEKMYDKVDNSRRNYDIIGGWACKSPLSGKEEFRFFVTDRSRDAAWLEEYYEARKPGTQVRRVDSLETSGPTVWDIYEIVPVIGG